MPDALEAIAPRGVSVVIPTTGRRSLHRAVLSAATQAIDGLEIILILDSGDPRAKAHVHEIAEEFSARVEVVTRPPRGAGHARHLGTRLASMPHVAYLDDDDHWYPGKLARQLDVGSALDGNRWLLSCRVAIRGGSGRSVIAPREEYRGGPLADYLFVRRRLSLSRALIHTSSLVLPTSVALDIGWRADLPRHQDWDFVLRGEQNAEVTVHQLRDVLLEVAPNSSDSISSADDWASSICWFDRMSETWSPRARADFLAGQIGRYCFQSRDLQAFRQVARRLGGAGVGRPSTRALILALAGLVPRRFWATPRIEGSRRYTDTGFEARA